MTRKFEGDSIETKTEQKCDGGTKKKKNPKESMNKVPQNDSIACLSCLFLLSNGKRLLECGACIEKDMAKRQGKRALKPQQL